MSETAQPPNQHAATGARDGRFESLLGVTEAIIAHRSLDELLRDLAAQLRPLVGFDYINVLLHDPARDVMRLRLMETPMEGSLQPGLEVPVEGTGAGWVWRTQRPLIVHDIDAEQRFPFTTDLFRRYGINAFYSFPLTSAGRRLGTMGFGSRAKGGCDGESVEFLQLVVKQVAVAVDNALNFERAARERDRRQLLLEVNNAVVSHLDLKELVKTVSASLRDVMPHDAAGIALYEPEANQLREYTNVKYRDLDAFQVGDTIPLEGTPAGEVFTTGQPKLIKRPNPSAYPADRYSQHPAEVSPKSACLAPLVSHGRKLGIAGVSSTQEERFTEDDLELFNQIAGQVAIAVENALNFESAASERDRSRLLLEITNAVTTHLGLRDLLLAVSACLRRFFEHDVASVVLCDEGTGQLRVHALDAPAPGGVLSEGTILPMEGTPPGIAIRTRSTIRRDRIDLEEFHSPMMRLAYEAGLRSGCSVPLVSHDRVLGTINVGSFREAAFTEADAELLEQIAGQMAVAVENALNFERATRERERAETLLDVSNAISASLDLRDLMRATSECLRRYFRHDFAGMALYDSESEQLRVHALDLLQPADKYVDEGFMIPLEGSPAGLAFTSRRAVLVRDLEAWETPSPVVARALAAGIRSSCNAPLVAHDRALGSVVVTSRRREAFDEADAELLTHIANQLAVAVENALQFGEIEGLKNKLASEKLYLEEEIKTEYNFAEIVGQSRALRRVLEQVETVAPTDSVVLICGETGTGKELIARAIHSASARGERTMVKVNCAAIPTGLLESEFFGHEKGAFTGAIAQRVGRFELANKGTLFLDEVGEIPLELQPKLLRVLQEQEFERLGSSRTVKVDVRLIAATNCDLPQMVAEKKFRSDLFYRLNVFPVLLPPLRERVEDIPLLVGYFAQKHSLRMNKRIESVPAETIEALCRYPWPGNVRELENFVERACILTRGAELRAPLAELKQPTAAATGDGAQATTGDGATPAKLLSLAEAERAHIEEVLRQTRGVVGGKGGAAEILGLPISTLRGRMKKLGIM